MKALTVVATALCLGIGGLAAADEPLRLDDAALDRVSAGSLLNGIAFGYGQAFSSGLTGGSAGVAAGRVLSVQLIQNGTVTTDTQVGARSNFTSFGSGPGPTSAGGSGGVFLSIF